LDSNVQSRLVRGQDLLASDPAAAAAEARSLLNASPDSVAAALLLGASLRRAARLSAAERVLSDLAARHPEFWGVWFELGATHAMIGATPKAVQALEQALRLNPRSALAAGALADQLAFTGADDPLHARALAAEARGSAAFRMLATAVLEGSPTAAAHLRERNMQLNDPVALNLIAQAGLEMGEAETVERLLHGSTARWPEFIPLRLTSALALHGQQRAIEILDEIQALARETGAVPVRGLLADALVQAGDDQAAHAVLEALLGERPDDPRLWISYGHVLKTLGRLAEAVDAYRRAIRVAPGCSEAYWSLANLKVTPVTSEDLSALQAELGRKDLEAGDRANLHFALGKGLEDGGDYQDAFQNYAKANDLRRVARAHDADAHSAFARQSIELFTPEFFAARDGQGCRRTDPIFVVGLPRSGSTLVEQILACHPAVEGCGELPVLPAIAREAARRAGADEIGYPKALARLPGPALDQLGETYLARTAAYRKLGRRRFVDKFPGNMLHVGLIHLILPRAKVIDVRRAPEPCCWSLFKQNFAQGQHYSHDLADLARYYRDYVALMEHMGAARSGATLLVRYEDLAAEPEREIRRMLDYLGLAFEPACLRPHESSRPVRTPSAEQVRRPISAENLESWRAFRPWLGALERALDGSE
jgi:tetratricopeptide (TPR) repeat protein